MSSLPQRKPNGAIFGEGARVLKAQESLVELYKVARKLNQTQGL